jgi:hypothetical protein
MRRVGRQSLCEALGQGFKQLRVLAIDGGAFGQEHINRYRGGFYDGSKDFVNRVVAGSHKSRGSLDFAGRDLLVSGKNSHSFGYLVDAETQLHWEGTQGWVNGHMLRQLNCRIAKFLTPLFNAAQGRAGLFRTAGEAHEDVKLKECVCSPGDGIDNFGEFGSHTSLAICS